MGFNFKKFPPFFKNKFKFLKDYKVKKNLFFKFLIKINIIFFNYPPITKKIK